MDFPLFFFFKYSFFGRGGDLNDFATLKKYCYFKKDAPITISLIYVGVYYLSRSCESLYTCLFYTINLFPYSLEGC